jgi:hypothetical protein
MVVAKSIVAVTAITFVEPRWGSDGLTWPTQGGVSRRSRVPYPGLWC